MHYYYLWEVRLGSGRGTMERMTVRRQTFLQLVLLFTDEIIMAAPLRITDVTSGLIGGEDGRVYVYNGKHTTFGDMTGKCKSWMSPCPEEKVVCMYKTGKQWLLADTLLNHAHCRIPTIFTAIQESWGHDTEPWLFYRSSLFVFLHCWSIGPYNYSPVGPGIILVLGHTHHCLASSPQKKTGHDSFNNSHYFLLHCFVSWAEHAWPLLSSN